MTVHEVWEKYKHMDEALSAGDSGSYSFRSQIISELWAAIKNEIEKGERG